jgi:diguanylate cyclase (GGDEF)-like protein/PAS domain S-box-containing protein
VPTDDAADLAAQVGAELSEALGDVVYALQVSPELRFIYVSPSIETLTGYTAAEHYADPGVSFDAIDPRDLPIINAALATDAEPTREFVVRSSHRDGRLVSTQHRCHKRTLEDGSVVVFAAARDVTAIMEAQRALAESEERYRLLAENASDLVWRTDINAIVEWVSPSVVTIIGWSPEQLVGRPITELVHPDDLDRVRMAGSTIKDGDRVSFEARYRSRDGAYRWLEVTARPITDAHGAIVGRVGSCRDVHAEIEAWHAMERSESRFRLAMDSAPIGMALTDLDRRFVEVNPALCRMLGLEAPALAGKRMIDVVNAVDDDIDLTMRDDLLHGGSDSTTREMRLIRSDGVMVWVQHAIGLLRDENNVPQSYVSQFVNVTEAREAREALHFMATHDPLTHLLNRRELHARMSRILAHAPRADRHPAVLYADLDGLKAVNDAFGHAIGDAVLLEAARRIQNAVREDDFAARVGGDEFVIVLPEARSDDDAASVALKIGAALAEPMAVGTDSISMGVCVGISIVRVGDDPTAVLQRADAALYRAKKSGRNRVEVFDPALDE